MISKHVSVAYKHMFEVKNTKRDQVKVILTEQLPLSTDERIKVATLFIQWSSYHAHGCYIAM